MNNVFSHNPTTRTNIDKIINYNLGSLIHVKSAKAIANTTKFEI